MRLLTFNAIIYKKNNNNCIHNIFIECRNSKDSVCPILFSVLRERGARYLRCVHNTRLHFGQRSCVIDNCFRIMKTCFNVIYWIVKDKGEAQREGRGAGGGASVM